MSKTMEKRINDYYENLPIRNSDFVVWENNQLIPYSDYLKRHEESGFNYTKVSNCIEEFPLINNSLFYIFEVTK